MSPVPRVEELAAATNAGIDVPRPADLAAYLARYPCMLQPLIQVSRRAAGAFSSDVHLSLELHRDREIDDEYLALYIRQQRYTPDILDGIERLSSNLRPELGFPAGWLLITTDFRPRRYSVQFVQAAAGSRGGID
jgi:hypothetical protein